MLVLHIENRRRVMNRAVLVVVIADRAVQHVILENAVKRFTLSNVDGLAHGLHVHSRGYPSRTRSRQFAIHLDQASVAAFDRPHLLYVANLRNRLLRVQRRASIQQIDQQLAGAPRHLQSINGQLSVWSVFGGGIQ
jgi:hypothetical protein